MGLGTKWDEEELILTWLTGIQKATPSVKSWQKGLLWCEVIRAPNTCILQKVVESRNAYAAQNTYDLFWILMMNFQPQD